MTWFTMVAGTIIYLIVGATIDTVMPSAHLLGMNVQALILSSASMGFALWLAVRLDLFG